MLKESDSVVDELQRLVPRERFERLSRRFHDRDGEVHLLKELPAMFPADTLAADHAGQRAWELVGLHYMRQQRAYESLAIFESLYRQMLDAQQQTRQRVHKGTPLCWMSDLYQSMGFAVHAKRFLMLTLCEDAVEMAGEIVPEKTGVYFRLVWGHGLPDSELRRYARDAYVQWQRDRDSGMFPEWMLQSLDTKWMSEFPSPTELEFR